MKFELNHTYLVKVGFSNPLLSVTVLIITDKAYHMRWNTGLTSNNTWELKDNVDDYYNIIEDISDFITSNKIDKESEVKLKSMF